MSTSKFISGSEAETRAFAAKFASTLKGSEKICLSGPLGSGKTTFVRGFVAAFEIPATDVQSPTFTLIREYETRTSGPHHIYHIDLYRLEKEEDIFEAGIYDVITGEDLVLIEWADRLKRFMPQNVIEIRFSHSGEQERLIEVV
jgi:tRNA threonylcarbamoyladenosine biosynthesis protein TsaE